MDQNENGSPPPTKLEVRPGEDIWMAAARELTRNPDSPASLQILSSVNKMVGRLDAPVEPRPRKGSPDMNGILASRPAITDTGYRLGIHLEGVEGTWHRLWAIIALTCGLGDDVDQDDGVATVRAQFEQVLGREMTQSEWAALVAHARANPMRL